MMADDNEIVQRILEYLREHPQAGDTLEGIAKWWLMCQQLSDRVVSVQRSLEVLKAQGVILEHKRPDGRSFYFARRTKPEI